MRGFFAALGTIWRLAFPYFRSEDRWAGRGLLAAVVAIELSLVAIEVLINQWNARFFNAIRIGTSRTITVGRDRCGGRCA